MNTLRRIKTVKLIGLLVFILFIVGSFIPLDHNSLNQGIQLERPSFLKEVKAEFGTMDTKAYDLITQEAGISAWMKSDFSINLSSVRSQFITIELETSDYIIGSIDMPNYVDRWDPHVFVHKDGWIMAYYLRGDPVSKIIDTKARNLNTTLLHQGISIIASNGGVPITTVKYYDFRYVNATHMMFIAEDTTDGNLMTILIPSTYGYYEFSWASNGTYPYIYIDGVNLWNTSITGADSHYTGFGPISSGLFTVDVTHNFSINNQYNCYGVIVVVYRVP